ncbi:hypothetical protein VNI00_014801 [Paramarasmius palmivorus]|uniref:Uncharacterized protein n=1 Tax=Paramarasmius palmivorus TaxID=297713 RepID=A0AAW0BTZ5_9AGAR
MSSSHKENTSQPPNNLLPEFQLGSSTVSTSATIKAPETDDQGHNMDATNGKSDIRDGKQAEDDGEEDEEDDEDEEDEEDDEDEEDEESGGSKKRHRGNPGNFPPEIVAFLEAALHRYMKLKKGSKDKELFFCNFLPEFFKKFPLDKYPPHEGQPLDPLPEYTPQEWKALMPDERKSYKRKAEVRSRTPEARQSNSVKQWFYWRVSSNKHKGTVSMNKFLENVKSAIKGPRRRSEINVVATHPDYKSVLKGLDKDERQKIKDFIEEDITSKVGKPGPSKDNYRYRQSFSHIMQCVIKAMEERTGLKIVVLAGGDMDGEKTFDTVLLSAGGPHATKIDEFDVDKHQDFIRYFYQWLRDIRVKTIEAGGSVPGIERQNAEGSSPGESGAQNSGALGTSDASGSDGSANNADEPTSHEPQTNSSLQSSLNQKKSKAKKLQKGKEREEPDPVQAVGDEETVVERKNDGERAGKAGDGDKNGGVITLEEGLCHLESGSELNEVEWLQLPYGD